MKEKVAHPLAFLSNSRGFWGTLADFQGFGKKIEKLESVSGSL